jgi:hypothetical protein
MNYEDLIKHVNLELQWLRYYTLHTSKKKLTVDSEIYETLSSIGYAKRCVPLDIRCASAIITAKELTTKTDVNDLLIVATSRNIKENRYTALEIFWILFPHRRNEVIKYLNAEQFEIIEIK